MTTNPFCSFVREPEPVAAQLGTERRRAKNTFLVMASLLAMQTRDGSDAHCREKLQQAEERLRVIVTLYDVFSRSGSSGLIEIADVLREVSSAAVRRRAANHVALHVFVDPLQADWETAVPLALLAHELVSDALEFAFVGRSAGRIEVALRIPAAASDVVLTVGDDGVARAPLGGTDAVRPKLIDVLLRQLRGRLNLESVSGTRLAVRFPIPS